MRADYLLVASLALSIATAAPLASQTYTDSPSIGSRLRVSTRGARPTSIVGSVVRVTQDTLLLRDAHGVTTTISLADAETIEISRRKVGHPNLGAAIGIGVGLLAGGIVGSATWSEPGDAPFECSGSFLCDRPTRAGRVLGGALLGGLVGAGIGALVGNNIKTDRWTTISAASLKPTASVRPTLNGGAVMSVAFRF